MLENKKQKSILKQENHRKNILFFISEDNIYTCIIFYENLSVICDFFIKRR